MTEAHVGLHAWERHPERPSRLLVNVEMFAPVPANPVGGFVDYDPIRAALRQWPSRPHTPLLEQLAQELVRLCFDNASVFACRVSVMKPDIFNEAAAAGVELTMMRDDFLQAMG